MVRNELPSTESMRGFTNELPQRIDHMDFYVSSNYDERAPYGIPSKSYLDNNNRKEHFFCRKDVLSSPLLMD